MGAVVGAGLLSGILAGAPSASASSTQISIIQDSTRLISNPAATLGTFRALGAGMVRVIVVWAQIAPNPKSRTAPSGFDAANPADYPATNWAPYDEIVRLATADGIAVDFTLSGGAPRWAEGSGIPPAALDNPYWAWRPSAPDFGQFAEAIGERYSGNYIPAGQTSPLPRVSFWAIWNEPNFGEDLGPQAIAGSSVSVSPGMYRSLVNQGWNALLATGHGGDTVLIGELAPRGQSAPGTRSQPQGLPGDFAQTKPLQFIRTLYCVNSAYRELRGPAAKAVGCPTTAAGSRGFRAANPGLFQATGFADHPYPQNQPPTVESSSDPDIAPFPRMPNLERELDRLQQLYGTHRRLPIYSTEYGYITHPPNRGAYVSPATAAYYINWAEYLSWKQPRVASTMQYLLYDPPVTQISLGGDGGFSSGLLFSGGMRKPAYAAYRLPLYLPVASTRRRRPLEVWGCVRPADYAIIDTGLPQTARIQFRQGSRGPFTTLATVTISSGEGCYFDDHLAFPSTGTVRLAYTYPAGYGAPGTAGTTVYSRSVAVTIR